MARRPAGRSRFTGLPPNPPLSSRIYVCMESTAEVHFHLLPGVDDGPAELADSVELARAAVADGTDTVVATPHVRSDFVTDVLQLRERVAEVRRALAAAGVSLAVACGGELAPRHGAKALSSRVGGGRPGPSGRPLAAARSP